MRTHVDLFSGIAGFALAAQWAGVETIAFAEIDPYASRVIERHFPGVRNYGDVRNVPECSAWLLTGGVPCQPASVAGRRRGAADDRWLWPEALAVVESGYYEWVLFENPTGILSLNNGVEFERICAALESQGYEVQPLVIPACAVGAPHRRNRVWVLAHRDREHVERRPSGAGNGIRGTQVGKGPNNHIGGSSTNVAHANEPRPQRRQRGIMPECSCQQSSRASGTSADTNSESMGRIAVARREHCQWTVEPDVGRVVDGIPKRVDRLRCLGNAIVPQVAYQLIKRMIEAEEVNEF